MFKSIQRISFPAILVGLVALAPAAIGGSGIWTSSGPNGGWVLSVIASPSVPSTFYAATRGGVFKSATGGLSWTDANAGIGAQLNGLLVHSETDPNTLYAFGSRRVYRSDDGATNWTERTPAGGLLPADAGFTAAATSKTTPGRLYAVMSDGSILRTSNSGLSWSRVTPALSLAAGEQILAIASHPSNAGELLVSVGDRSGFVPGRLVRLTSAGSGGSASAADVSCPPGCAWENVAFGDIEFAGATGRVWASGVVAAYSDDFGATWTETSGGGGGSLSVDPTDSTRVYVAGPELTWTSNNGATWSTPSSFPGNGAGLAPNLSDVVIDPFDPRFQLVATDPNGVYRNTAAGADAYTQQVTGMNATNIRAVATGPGNRLHAGVGDSFGATFASFISSAPASISWGPAYTGLQADQFRALEVDPNDPSVVYGGGLFFPKSDGMGSFIDGNGGIYKSTNGGTAWSTIDTGIPLDPGFFNQSLLGTVRTIEIDETSALGGTGPSQTLLLGGSGRFTVDDCGLASPTFTQQSARIFKSNDAGASWSPSEAGLGAAECSNQGFPMHAAVVQIVQSEANPSEYWAATFIVGSDSTDAPAIIENGVFRSINGGVSWVHSSNGLPDFNGNPGSTAANVLSLAYDPTDVTGQTLYASTNEDFLGTVYTTVDGGVTWTFAGTGLTSRDVRDLIVNPGSSPTDPGRGHVYAAVADPGAGGDGGVFVSEDGGASWVSVSTGFPASAVATKVALRPTPVNLQIYAGTTRGLQAFERIPDGDLDGASDGDENSVPSPMRGSGDGNGDGTPDAEQADVASPVVFARSTRGFLNLTATVEPAFAGAGSCDRLENSFGLELLPAVPTESVYEAPFNGLHLRVPDCTAARIELIYHGQTFADDPSYRVRGYGLLFPDAVSFDWQEVMGASVSGSTWIFEVEDGGTGDATEADGVIVFQGGAKRLREAFFADSMEAE